jgi:SOS-response transcriptional repressor LexA
MAKSPSNEICRRIAQVRAEVAGPRGKSAFARMLGLSPSTYDYYESDRVPPAKVLLSIADAAGVDLRWLLTGRAAPGRAVPADHPALQRAARLLAEHPQAAGPLSAFLDILAESMTFPDGGGIEQGEPDAAAVQPPDPDRARQAWVPVLGRSAAGVPQFWSPDEPTNGLTTLRQLVDRHVTAEPQRVRPASADADQPDAAGEVQLITLSRPQDGEVAEFVAAEAAKRRHPDAFAVRIDGESMAPDIRHGDLVLLSPSAPAEDGKPAVVQLAGQIGVTCKIFRRERGRVHLVPVNEEFEPSAVPAGQVVWALRVLARIRVAP